MSVFSGNLIEFVAVLFDNSLSWVKYNTVFSDSTNQILHIYRPRSGEIMYLVASVRPFVCMTVRALLFEPRGRESLEARVIQYAGNCVDAVDRLLTASWIFNPLPKMHAPFVMGMILCLP